MRVHTIYRQTNKGFTLVELLVSISIFVIIMTIVMGAIFSVLDLNSKVQTEKTAMDNLNFALESMSRTVRFGTSYHCGVNAPTSSPRDCSAGDTVLTVLGSDGTYVTYSLVGTTLMQTQGGVTLPLTSPEVVIQSLTFRVIGSYAYGTDYLQPQVIVTVSGYAGSANKAKTQSAFQLETTISQRKLDI